MTLQAEAFHVVLVAEGAWLVRPLTLLGHPRRPLQLVQRHTERDDDQARQHQAKTSQRIRTAVKNLRHECVPASSASKKQLRGLKTHLALGPGCAPVIHSADELPATS